MSKSRKKRRLSGKAGLPPGSLIHVGEEKTEPVTIAITDYGPGDLTETVVRDAAACAAYRDTDTVTWINVNGVHDTAVVERLGNLFNIHPLVLEDIVNTEQRPKFEVFNDYLFIVIKMLMLDEHNENVRAEQVSILLCPHCIISFQEQEGDVFAKIRERLRNEKSRIRRMGPDYLMYALLDAIVDGYFGIIEKFGERIENVEREVIVAPAPKTIQTIYAMKRDMIFLRRLVYPLREVIGGAERSETSLVDGATMTYLRDVYDHTIQVMDTIESSRDLLSGLLDSYLSSVSNKMNEVMKVLTIIATIFIPLTFIAGIYGMNFEYMPELGWRWGYPLVWMVMGALTVAMVVYFRRKNWL
jgi:magnesium transporter